VKLEKLNEQSENLNWLEFFTYFLIAEKIALKNDINLPSYTL